MTDVLIAEQLSTNLDEVPQYEKSFNEGDTGELRIFLQSNISEEQIFILQQDILNQGVVLTDNITQDARILVIPFKKAIEPLLAVVNSISTIAGLIIGWQLLKDIRYGIPLWGWTVMGGIVLYYISKSYKSAEARYEKV